MLGSSSPGNQETLDQQFADCQLNRWFHSDDGYDRDLKDIFYDNDGTLIVVVSFAPGSGAQHISKQGIEFYYKDSGQILARILLDENYHDGKPQLITKVECTPQSGSCVVHIGEESTSLACSSSYSLMPSDQYASTATITFPCSVRGEDVLLSEIATSIICAPVGLPSLDQVDVTPADGTLIFINANQDTFVVKAISTIGHDAFCEGDSVQTNTSLAVYDVSNSAPPAVEQRFPQGAKAVITNIGQMNNMLIQQVLVGKTEESNLVIAGWDANGKERVLSIKKIDTLTGEIDAEALQDGSYQKINVVGLPSIQAPTFSTLAKLHVRDYSDNSLRNLIVIAITKNGGILCVDWGSFNDITTIDEQGISDNNATVITLEINQKSNFNILSALSYHHIGVRVDSTLFVSEILTPEFANAGGNNTKYSIQVRDLYQKMEQGVTHIPIRQVASDITTDPAAESGAFCSGFGSLSSVTPVTLNGHHIGQMSQCGGNGSGEFIGNNNEDYNNNEQVRWQDNVNMLGGVIASMMAGGISLFSNTAEQQQLRAEQTENYQLYCGYQPTPSPTPTPAPIPRDWDQFPVGAIVFAGGLGLLTVLCCGYCFFCKKPEQDNRQSGDQLLLQQPPQDYQAVGPNGGVQLFGDNGFLSDNGNSDEEYGDVEFGSDDPNNNEEFLQQQPNSDEYRQWCDRIDKLPDIPENMQGMICPISRILIMAPVVAADGNTYERHCIEEWFSNHDTSPMTGAILQNKNLVSNSMAKSQILEWVENQERELAAQQNQNMGGGEQEPNDGSLSGVPSFS